MIGKFPLLEELAILLGKLPGVGKKTAMRYALWFAEHQEDSKLLSDLLGKLSNELTRCKLCRNITLNKDGVCDICADENRDHSLLCVVESIENLFAIEASGVYNGVYYILGGLESSLYGIDPEGMGLDYLVNRVLGEGVKEIVLVVSSTLEGDLTAQYIKEKLKDTNVKLTRIAYGIPVGTSVNYIDKTTLLEAFKSRKEV